MRNDENAIRVPRRSNIESLLFIHVRNNQRKLLEKQYASVEVITEGRGGGEEFDRAHGLSASIRSLVTWDAAFIFILFPSQNM